MNVLKNCEQGTEPGHPFQVGHECRERALLKTLWRKRWYRKTIACRNRKQGRQQGDFFGVALSRLRQQSFELVQPRVRLVVALDSARTREPLDDWMQRAALMMRRAVEYSLRPGL